MKKMLSFLVFSILTASVFAQVEQHDHSKHGPNAHAATPSTTAPVAIEAGAKAITLAETLGVKETEFNFGKIPQGKPVTHVFEVSNTGKIAFKLDDVHASCGCTTPVWNKEESIEPGKTAIITVGYNAAAEGPFTKPVTITYNGTQSKVIMIKGEVWKTPSTSAPLNEAAIELKQ